MNDKFVIVIEVDNKRAQDAYGKGLASLEASWPQLMKHASKNDTQNEILFNAKLLEYERSLADYRKASNTYNVELKEWETRFFKGDRPKAPSVLDYESYIKGPPWKDPSDRRYLESVRAKLQKMANIAALACAPYRMTEDQVGEMISWEDGTKVDALLKEMQQEAIL